MFTDCLKPFRFSLHWVSYKYLSFLRLSICYRSYIFHSCIFHPCYLLPHCPLLRFPTAFSAPPYSFAKWMTYNARLFILQSIASRQRIAYRHNYSNAGLLSKVSEEVATEIAKKCRRRQPKCRLTPPIWGTPSNICYTYISGNYNHWPTFSADSMGLSSFIFYGVLRKTHLFCHSAFRLFRVIQGHWFWYESEVRMRLSISPS